MSEGPLFPLRVAWASVSEERTGVRGTGGLGLVPGVIGTLQAVEALKIILGLGTPLVGRLLFYDSLGTSFDEIDVSKNPACPICGAKPSIVAPFDYEEPCGNASPGDRPMEISEKAAPDRSISVSELKRRLQRGERPFFLDIQKPGKGKGIFAEGVLCIPLNEIMSRISEIPKDREVIVLCRIGVQSRALIRELRGLGYDNLINLEGGTIAWKYGIDVVP